MQRCIVTESQSYDGRVAESQRWGVAEIRSCRVTDLQSWKVAELLSCRVEELQRYMA